MNLPAQLPTEYRFGNSNRNTITGPGIINIDASLDKNFAITENHRVEFRFEVFNAPKPSQLGPARHHPPHADLRRHRRHPDRPA